MTFDLKYYLSVFWRRFPYFVIVVAAFTSAAITIAAILPPEYEANALLLVESEQIPSSLAESTVQTTASEQLQIIEQRIKTRENLLDVANRLSVYKPDPSGQIMSASDIVDDMRDRLTFSSTTGKDTATIATIKFRSSNSTMAAEVVNEFVTLLLQDNVQMRTERASETLEFFEQERDRLGASLDKQSAEILKFKTENAGTLPIDQDVLRARSTSLMADKATLTREIDALTSQKDQFTEIFTRTGSIGTGKSMSPQESALDAARKELDQARLVYSEQNPKLRVLAARVSQLETSLSETLDAGSGGSGPDGQLSEAQNLFNAQIAQIDSQIDFRQSETSRIDAELASIDETLKGIPSNAIALDKLERDYANIQAQYDSTVNRMSQAATGERIELLAKGQRISVIEQATPPETPTKPNRLLISAGGTGAGIAAGFGLVFLMELLNTSIRRPVELTNKLGITPLATLPYIRTEREVFRKRLMLISIVALFLVVLPLVLFAVHSLYYPLDGLIEPLANKLGFSLAA